MEGSVFKGRHFDRSVILLCVRWYLAYGLSLRNLEEMMAERGVSADHATIHRWTVHYAPLLLEQFNRRKRPVTGRWHVDEMYIKVRGQWRYLYRTIDSMGTRSSSGSANAETSLRPSAFYARLSSDIADPSGSSSTAARLTRSDPIV
jgi:hypothetical protein